MKRPTFSELRSKLRELISQDFAHLNFDIDGSKACYLEPSFRITIDSHGHSDDDDDDDDMDGRKAFLGLSNQNIITTE